MIILLPVDGLIQKRYRNDVAQGKVVDHHSVGGREEAATLSSEYFCSSIEAQPSQSTTDEISALHSGGAKVEVWTRVSPGVDYVKLVVRNGRIIGALLIGDTDLEEVFENLIMNELDVSRYGIDILDPDIDIEDYFD
jgi:hypothetical protein